jgi:branched-chain amino acid transport system substrate-binding protein
VILDSKALTKIQAVLVIAIVVVAGVIGSLVYLFWGGLGGSGEAIRIGVLGDLDNVGGRDAWQGAVLAAEQVNAEGGVLGRRFEIVAADDDSETAGVAGDVSFGINALTKLIAVDKVNFLFSSNRIYPILYQDICADHDMIFFSMALDDEMAQRVADDYDRYKGFFRATSGNNTSAVNGIVDDINTLRDYTGFDKVAFLTIGVPSAEVLTSGVVDSLQEQGFDIVYDRTYPPETVDFSSYFANVEASGAEILYPVVAGSACVPFVKEYYDRQSPVVIWGNVMLASDSDFWELTEGKCEDVSFVGYPVVSGYPLTNKTVPTREAYLERWGEVPSGGAATTYDLIRFILPDAIRRAGTIETDAVISALEETNVETSSARHFVYTSTHDVFIGEAGPNKPSEDYLLVCLFQWQDGDQVPVYPKEIMQEAGATYKFPPWSGPWD